MAIGNPFTKLNQLYSGRLDSLLNQLKNDFRIYADAYFNQNRTPADHDKFFGAFTPIWLALLEKRRYFEAIKIWTFALGLSFDWQKRNKPDKIHKGTPYYFLGVTAILNNELERGFLAMHQALKEDKRLFGRRIPEAPAFWFVTLDYSKQKQFFRMKVEQIAKYLSDRLQEYSTKRGGSMTLPQFRKKFLKRRALVEEVFLFVYSMFKLRNLVIETPKIYKKNVFSVLLHAKLLFDLALITDKVVEYKNPNRGNRLSFRDEMIFLSSPSMRLLSFNQNRITTINRNFDNDFSGTSYDILFGRYNLSLSDIENDFALAYGIRNLAAHKVKNEPVLYHRTRELAQSILNTLFFTVEKLY